jgi:hypothetical protein
MLSATSLGIVKPSTTYCRLHWLKVARIPIGASSGATTSHAGMRRSHRTNA